MTFDINRRSFLHLGMRGRCSVAGTAVGCLPRPLKLLRPPIGLRRCAQQAPRPRSRLQSFTTTSGCCRVQAATWRCRPGKDGIILIDSSFATAVPHIREAIAAVSSDAPHGLINTHWHVDHVDGNEGMHAAGYHVIAHEKTKARMAEPAEMKLFHMTIPAYPAGALPSTTFATTMQPQAQRRHASSWFTMILRTPIPTSTFTSRMPMCCTAATSSSTRPTPSSTKAPGGSIGGTIAAAQKSLALAGDKTKIIPGHGPLGDKADLKKLRRHAFDRARQGSCA